MEFGLPPNQIPRTILRPEDAIRLPRALRVDSHDRHRASSEDTQLKGAQPDEPMHGLAEILADNSPPRKEEETSIQPRKAEDLLLSLDETTELFKSKIEHARQDTEQALAGNEEVNEAVRPRLTLDLGHSYIARLPDNVVDLIKVEVERLSLSHNQIWHIPLRFSECIQLRYLNIRKNVFREIPRGVCITP